MFELFMPPLAVISLLGWVAIGLFGAASAGAAAAATAGETTVIQGNQTNQNNQTAAALAKSLPLLAGAVVAWLFFKGGKK